MTSPTCSPHRTDRLYGLAVSYNSNGIDGPQGTTVIVLPLPLTPAAAAKWSLAGLPVAIASSVDEIQRICRTTSSVAAKALREHWDGLGITVDVMTPHQPGLFTAGSPAETSER